MAGKRDKIVADAVDRAERATGLQFCVYLGPSEEEPRALAERLFETASTAGHPAVLLLVSPVHRRVEILTADWAQERVPDAACEAAIEHMRPLLRSGKYDQALVEGIAHLATVAGEGEPEHPDDELPDMFDER